jgi:hypothetical protein
MSIIVKIFSNQSRNIDHDPSDHLSTTESYRNNHWQDIDQPGKKYNSRENGIPKERPKRQN